MSVMRPSVAASPTRAADLLIGDISPVTGPVRIVTGVALRRGTVLAMNQSSGIYRPAVAMAPDGIGEPCAVLAADSDTRKVSQENAQALVYLFAYLAGSHLTFDRSWTPDQVAGWLRRVGLFVDQAC